MNRTMSNTNLKYQQQLIIIILMVFEWMANNVNVIRNISNVENNNI